MEETKGKAGESVGYKRAISLLDAEVLRLKQESQSKSQQIELLTGRLHSLASLTSAGTTAKKGSELYSAGIRRELEEAYRKTAAAEQEIQPIPYVSCKI